MTNSDKALIIDSLNLPFNEFYKKCFTVLTGIIFKDAPYIDILLDGFNKIYKQDIENLSIQVSPRLGKTLSCNIFCIYTILNNPTSQFIIVSSNYRLIQRSATFIRECIRKLLPATKSGFSLSRADASKASISIVDKAQNPRGSIFLSTAESALLGVGAGSSDNDGFSGAIILDDLSNSSIINSAVYRESLEGIFETTILSRRNRNCSVIQIAQRLHIDDFSNYFINKSPLVGHIHSITIPLENELGVICAPAIYTKTRVEQLKKNPIVFATMYQQNPYEDLNSIFLNAHFIRKAEVIKLKEFDTIFITADTAYTSKNKNDASVAFVIGIKNEDIYLIDYFQIREEWNNLKLEFNKLIIKYKNLDNYNGCFIENKASGISLIQELNRLGYNIHKLEPASILEDNTLGNDKVSRAVSILEYINDHKLHIPDDLETGDFLVDKIISEIISFPNGAHDDCVDALVYAYLVIFKKFGLFNKYEGEYFINLIRRLP